jgi:hypothetical protein
MAFELLDIEGDYPCEVTLKGAVLNTGETKDLVFTAIFKRMDQDEINKLLLEIDAADSVNKAIKRGDLLPSDAIKAVTDVQFADKILSGWVDLTRNGEVMEVNEENRNAVLQKQGVASAVVEAWGGVHSKGSAKERDAVGKRATSKPSRGNGIAK